MTRFLSEIKCSAKYSICCRLCYIPLSKVVGNQSVINFAHVGHLLKRFVLLSSYKKYIKFYKNVFHGGWCKEVYNSFAAGGCS